MFQEITIVGYLGKDPVMRFTPNGKAVTDFSIATSRSYTGSNGQKVDETTWFRVSVWGAQAESVNQYLKKGSPALVVGTIKPDPQTGGPRQWTGDDGVVRTQFEVNARNVRFLPGGGNSNAVHSDNQENMPDDTPEEKEERDAPFL